METLMRDIRIRLALVAALGLAAAPGSGAGVQVQKAWGPVAAPQGAIFLAAAPRTDGTVTATTGNGVFVLAPGGTVKPLGSGDRAILDPVGGAYGLWKKDAIEIFDAGGGGLGSLPALPFSLFKLAPGGKFVYAPRIEVQHEEPWVKDLRLVRPDGSVLAEMPAPGLEISRLDADRIVYTLPSSLVARTLDGKELWNAKLDVHQFETAADRVILVPRYVAGRVVHLAKGQRVSESPVEGVVWNLAIAPAGRLSAATTQRLLYIFLDGKRTAQVSLPVTYANSLAITDGLVLIGGQGARGEGRLLLYDRQGALLWQGEAGIDTNGYRPDVRFAPGGDRFVVLERRGLTVYDILGSQP
jgi:hypothetical protein